MKPQAVYQTLQSDPSARLIDVREQQEYQTGHADGAVSMPLSSLAEALPTLTLPKDTVVFVICQSGGRSQVACTLFSANGFRNVTNVDGGTLAWQEDKLPMSNS